MYLRLRVLRFERPMTDRFCWGTSFSRRAVKSILLSLWLIFPGVVAAEPTTASNNTLTLPQAIERAIKNSPELKPFIYRLEAQQARVTQAGVSPKPEFSVTVEDALGSGVYEGFDSAQTTLGISWVLEGKLKQRRADFAQSEYSFVEAEREMKLVDTTAQTAHYFLYALALQQRIEIAEQFVKLMEQTRRNIKKRVTVGRAPTAELLSAEVDLAQYRLSLMDFQHELETTYIQLAAQWGNLQPAFTRVEGSLSAIPELASFESLKQSLLDSPHLARYLTLERVTEAELHLAEQQSQREPWRFSVGVRKFQANDDHSVVAGLSIPFRGGTAYRGRISEVQATLAAQQAEGDALRIRIETDLFRLYRQLENNVHTSIAFRDTIVPKLEQAETEIHKGYELGKHSYLELLAVQNKLVEARLRLLDASLNAHLNIVEIERLTGAQLSPYLK